MRAQYVHTVTDILSVRGVLSIHNIHGLTEILLASSKFLFPPPRHPPKTAWLSEIAGISTHRLRKIAC